MATKYKNFMKMRSNMLLLLLVLIFVSCQKNDNQNISNNSKFLTTLKYPDSLVFLNQSISNYTILPQTKPADSGYFKAYPSGLTIDSVSGAINVNLSETGIRFKVIYFNLSNKPLDSSKIIISGIDYKDAIVRLTATPIAYDTIFPIYNGNSSLLLPCGNEDEDDDGDLDDDDNLCVFDETDLDNDGNDDIPGAIQEKLLIDIKTGTIDLEASFYAGIFGSSNPANGIIKNFTMYYRLNDFSNRALNKIDIRVYHYQQISDIPQTLLDELNERKLERTYASAKLIDSGPINLDPVNNEILRVLNILRRPKLIRPPFIVIVSS